MEYKILLTGTPIINHQSDIFGILKFLLPDQFVSYWKFVEDFFEVKEIETRFSSIRSPGNFKSRKKEEELLKIVNSISVRRSQKEVLK